MKIPGHCSQCDAEIFEVLTQYARDHPKAGQPRRLGRLVDQAAASIAFVLTNGSHTTMTFCGACAGGKIDLKLVWAKMLTLMADMLNRNSAQQVKDVAVLANESLLGELYREKWKELSQDGTSR